MSRVATTWYAGSSDTQFQWATTDNDLFDRELDLYRLAQALEGHTHGVGKGLPVDRLADLTITNTMYGALSIPTGAIQDLAITRPKIANNAVDDTKLDAPRLLRAGDTSTGDLRLTRGGGVSGAVFFGTGNNYMYFDGGNFDINNSGGNLFRFYGLGVQTWRQSAPNTGYFYAGNAGTAIGFNGTNWVLDAGAQSGIIQTTGNNRPVPLGGILAFRTAAEITAAGAGWIRENVMDGRIVVGAGTTAGVTFTENTTYGTNWRSVLSLSSTTFNAGPGATTVLTSTTLNGLTTDYIPPAMCVVWGKRIS
jgi:hypothetical protein